MPESVPRMEKLRVFISYPGRDGLYKARQAANVLDQYGHKPWLYEQHSTLGAPLFREIAVCIRRKSDALLYICTDSSLSSWGQQLEAGYALSNRNVRILPIVLNNAQIPDELTGINYARVQSNRFQKQIKAVASNLQTTLERTPRLGEDIEAKIT